MTNPESQQHQDFVSINDALVLAIPVIENNEEMIPLLNIDTHRIVLPSLMQTKFPDIEDSTNCIARISVGNALQKALTLLPENQGLVIIEAYRDYNFQKQLFLGELDKTRKENPQLSEDEILEIASITVANPDIYAPHTTGGAVDVAPFSLSTNDYLDMGNSFTHDASAISDYPNLTEDQKNNRNIFSSTMAAAGFINYPREWWHFSLGDKYYAYIKGESTAQYGNIVVNQ